MILSKEESITYIGGAKITAAIVSAVTSMVKYIYGMGQNLGSTIRRLFSKSMC